MCIILTCEPNVRPDNDLIETCFFNNPDGAGFMYCDEGRVQIAKGYMDVTSLIDALQCVPNDSRLAIHMRIATSGGVDTGTCHPFPIWDDLEILHSPYVECDAAMVHNGIIAGMPTDDKRGISDTVYFVSSIVNEMYQNEGLTKSVRRRIKKAAPGNRFAILTKDNELFRLGVGWETVDKGLYASNSTWRYSKHSLYYDYNWANWDDDEWYDDWYESWSEGWKRSRNAKRSRSKGADFYNSRHFEQEQYEEIFNCSCGDCNNIGNCMAYGAECDNVAALVDEWYDCVHGNVKDSGQLALLA